MMTDLLRDIEDHLAFTRNDELVREIEESADSVTIERDDEQILLRDGTPATVPAWGVWVCGYRHGGRHPHYLDALHHYGRCREWTAEERAEWVRRHQALEIEAA